MQGTHRRQQRHCSDSPLARCSVMRLLITLKLVGASSSSSLPNSTNFNAINNLITEPLAEGESEQVMLLLSAMSALHTTPPHSEDIRFRSQHWYEVGYFDFGGMDPTSVCCSTLRFYSSGRFIRDTLRSPRYFSCEAHSLLIIVRCRPPPCA